ncbi:hypothetical protein RNZ50_16760 [Paracoccaceae bacterium Fryx2]|nr:hypothetical protein [Paracoccaceae bacterium Fryx2]
MTLTRHRPPARCGTNWMADTIRQARLPVAGRGIAFPTGRGDILPTACP